MQTGERVRRKRAGGGFGTCGGMALLAVVCSALWLMRSSPETKIGISSRCTAWPNVIVQDWGQGYQWTSPHQILTAGNGGLLTFPQGLLQFVDVSSGSAAKQVKISQAKTGNYWGETTAFASPDGSAVLTWGDKGFSLLPLRASGSAVSVNRFVAMKNGSPAVRHPVCWMPDSLHWIEFSMQFAGSGYRSMILIHNRQGGIDRKILLPAGNLWVSLLGVSPEGHAILEEWKPKSLALYEVDLSPKQQNPVPQILPIRLPFNASDLSLSPQGDRVLWQTHSYLMVDLLALLRRRKRASRWEMHTARLDGTKERTQLTQWLYDRDRVEYPAWTTDSKQISFISGKQLYTFPAP